MFKRLQTKIAVSVSVIAGWLTFGTFMYHFLEKWSYVKSFYFSVVTLTTVGYGDLYPTTDISRLFTAIYLLFGVGIVLAALGVIGSDLLSKREVRAEEAIEKHKTNMKRKSN